MKICVAGTGYVGLVAGTCLAESGNDVICVDSDKKKVEKLSSGTPTIYEPGLGEYLRRNLMEKRLSFTTDLESAVKKSEVVFIAVGTPIGRDMQVDLSSVWKVAEQAGKAIEGYTVVVIKSTVPVGTAKRVKEIISGATKHEFSVVSNPEFLKEGAAVDDFMKPDRVVVGAEPQDTRALEIMRELYAPFLRTGKPLIEMTNASAEVCKYACNSFLATKISFVNQVANFCQAVGADINDIRRGMGTDPRIGPQFLFPGVGFGGSCFPKDIAALIGSASQAGARMDILEGVHEVNERQKLLLVERVKKHFGEDLSGKKGAVWGLSFKPRTDDIREAPSIPIIQGLLEAGASLSVFDPVAMQNAQVVLGEKVEYAHSNYDAVKDADFLAVVTEWNEFRRPNFERIKQLMRTPVIFDGRNIFSRRRMESLGFTYYGIGC
jgi:UDPglucose 6-dehydrogenase